ncbi:MAG: type VI secretion system ATPase TssH [Planctomycetota bacterium]
MNLNLKSLVGKLTPTARRGLEGAAGSSLSRSHFDVDMEHWIAKLLEENQGDVARILSHFDVAPDGYLRDLNRALDTFKTGNSRRPELTETIQDMAKDGWVLASVNYGASRVRSGVLFLAALQNDRLYRRLLDISGETKKINREALAEGLSKIVGGSSEDHEVLQDSGGAASRDVPAGGQGGATSTPALDKFTIDLTAAARSGRIDPVLGRDPEIRQIVDILTRRRQNNPILTGEAGVGKTAVVEGFAQRIADGDVPEPLRNVVLRTLDLGLLQAGAGVKGEFENRLKQVIEEVRSSPQPIILFIDEAHTLIGAGGAEGQNDAANLLKPALARGELRTIAATTWAEYKKFFEKDAALSRRFQVIKVEEPSEAAAMEMMRGVAQKLETHHGVGILDEAIQESVRSSHRYIPARQLPDVSVSVLDTACARVAIGQGAIPAQVEDLRRRIESLARERAFLERESDLGTDHEKRLATNAEDSAAAKDELAQLEERWEKEKELVTRICEIQARLRRDIEPAEDAPAPPTDEERKTLRAELDQRRQELSALQGERPLIQPQVDAQTIAEVISGWTGIPVGRMVADEIQTVLDLASRLEGRVIGQSHALEAIASRIQTSRAKLDNPNRPVGVFLLAGPSGVGKTETALALSEALYGGERNLVTINMSEYQEAHTVSSLKGSPPGYVGYGEGGVLTEAVRRRPYSVVLLDEVEKAHPDVMELFFQVFDKGMLEDGEGRDIDFKNTVILLTSNVGTETIMKQCADPETMPEVQALAELVRQDLLASFPPALLGRLVVIPYYAIAPDVLRKIITLQLERIVTRVRDNHAVDFHYGEELVEAVAGRCNESDSGARKIDQILTHTLLPMISTEFLSRMARGEAFSRVQIGVGDDGDFRFQIE